MSCPVPITPWTPSGWNPASLSPGSVNQIVPPTSVVPSGAGAVYLQLSVKGNPGDAVGATDSNGNQAGNPVRAQVSGIWNDTLGFAQMFGNAFYIKNFNPNDTVSVTVVILAYS